MKIRQNQIRFLADFMCIKRSWKIFISIFSVCVYIALINASICLIMFATFSI